jgi:hypothetical protein
MACSAIILDGKAPEEDGRGKGQIVRGHQHAADEKGPPSSVFLARSAFVTNSVTKGDSCKEIIPLNLLQRIGGQFFCRVATMSGTARVGPAHAGMPPLPPRTVLRRQLS